MKSNDKMKLFVLVKCEIGYAEYSAAILFSFFMERLEYIGAWMGEWSR
jgi:hypothetical protein